MRTPAAILLAATGLAACSTLPKEAQTSGMCGFNPETLVIDDPEFDDPDRPKATIFKSALIMSGGGEKGAFGAGFLKGWADGNGGRLPEFDMVTGISTGAILATWAFVNDPETPAREYRIDKESQILRAYAKLSKSGDPGMGAAIKLIRKNSLADLSPLRDRLQYLIDADLLRKVAEHPGELKVGAVEVDTGELQLFDMKDMARKAVKAQNANDGARFRRFRDCYVDAILASSSVPVGAQPVFIDNRMYIDGGVRQGVFVDYLSKIQRQVAYDSKQATEKWRKDHPGQSDVPEIRIEKYKDDAALQDWDPVKKRRQAPRLYIIMNGTQWAERKCGKLSEADCNAQNHIMPDPVKHARGQHGKWQVAKLAFRTTDILANQIYRFSAKRTEEQYKLLFPSDQFAQRFHFVRMHRTDLSGDLRRDRAKEAKKYAIEDEHRHPEAMSCPDWAKLDQKLSNPLQFHPHYMKCLVQHGEAMAKEAAWFRPETGPQFDDRMTLE